MSRASALCKARDASTNCEVDLLFHRGSGSKPMTNKTNHRCQDRRATCPTSNTPLRPGACTVRVVPGQLKDRHPWCVCSKFTGRLVTQILQPTAQKSPGSPGLPRLLFSSVVYLRYVSCLEAWVTRTRHMVTSSFPLHCPDLFLRFVDAGGRILSC